MTRYHKMCEHEHIGWVRMDYFGMGEHGANRAGVKHWVGTKLK